jgi:O-antigen/teichoic acid export membrane protein
MTTETAGRPGERSEPLDRSVERPREEGRELRRCTGDGLYASNPRSIPPSGSVNATGKDPSSAVVSGLQRSAQGESLAGDRMRLSELVRISTPLLVPWSLQLGSAYVLLLVLPRILGPSEYAKATAAVSLYLVVTAGSIALQARLISEIPSWSEPSADFGNGWSRLPSAILTASVVLVATPPLSALLDVPLAPLTLLAPALLISLLSSDRMQTHERSRWSRVVIALGAGAATRVAAGVTVALLGLGLVGIMVGIVIAEAVTFCIAWYQTHDGGHDREGSSASTVRLPQLRPTIGAVAAVVLIAQLDILFVRYRLPAVQAGQYAGAAVLTRVLLFIPVLGAVFVMRRGGTSDDADPFRWLHRSLMPVGAAIVVVWVAMVLFRTPLTTAVLGGSFEEASTLVPVLAAAAGFLALVWQLSFFHVVVESKAHALILVVVVVEVMLLGIFAWSPMGIAVTALSSASVAALLHYIGARAISRWSPPLTRLRPHEEVDSAPSTSSDGDIELSMIVPCYNPGPALESFLTRLTVELEHEGPNEIIVVSDGSTDDSVGIARRFASPSFRVIHYAERSGKGHALRVGLSSARGSYIGFIDGDGEIDPLAVGPFLSLMRLYEPDVILGSKRHPMSVVSYPGLRRIMSWVYHKLTRVLFRINVRDTQTGLKVIRRDVLSEVLPRMLEKRYAFDLELLVVARVLGFTKVFEAPVRIDYRFSSNVNPDAVFRILLDTAAVFYRRYVLDTYRHAGDRLFLVRSADEDLQSRRA